MEVFILRPEEFNFSLKRDDILAWDSLGLIAVTVAVKDVFGCHFKPEEALALKSFQDIKDTLKEKGIAFDE